MGIQLLLCVLLVHFIAPLYAIYATQLGEYDWHHKGIGYITQSHFLGGHSVFVTTEDSVVASLDPATGDVQWRLPLLMGTKIVKFASTAHTINVLTESACPSKKGTTVNTFSQVVSNEKESNTGCREYYLKIIDIKTGALRFDVFLRSATSKEVSSHYDIYYSKLSSGFAVSVLLYDQVFHVDGINMSNDANILAHWSPQTSSVPSASNIKVLKLLGENSKAVGCVVSKGYNTCGKTVVLSNLGEKEDGKGDYPSVVSYSSLNIDYTNSDIKMYGDNVVAATAKGMTVLSLSTNKVTVLPFPSDALPLTSSKSAPITSLKLSLYVPSATRRAKIDAGQDAESVYAVMYICSNTQCDAYTVEIQDSIDEGSVSVVSSASKLSLLDSCSSSNGVMMGIGEYSHSLKDKVWCVVNGEGNDDIDLLYSTGIDSSDDSETMQRIALPSTITASRQSLGSFVHANVFPYYDGANNCCLSLLVSSTGTTIAFKKSSKLRSVKVPLGGGAPVVKDKNKSGGKYLYHWHKEESLSRVMYASLMDKVSESNDETKHIEGSIAFKSAHLNKFLGGLSNTFWKSISAFVDVIEFGVTAVTGEGESTSDASDVDTKKNNDRTLTSSQIQAQLYGFDKIALMISRGSEASGPILIAYEVLYQEVVWMVSLSSITKMPLTAYTTTTPYSSVSSTATEMTLIKPLSMDDNTIALLLSNEGVGSEVIHLDFSTGERINASITFSQVVVQVNAIDKVSTSNEDSHQIEYALLVLPVGKTDVNSNDLRMIRYPLESSKELPESLFIPFLNIPGSIYRSMTTKVTDTKQETGVSQDGQKEYTSYGIETLSSTVFNAPIVAVSYPNAGDPINSKVRVLGDDSVLLKYLNPHSILIVTESKNITMGQEDGTGSSNLMDTLDIYLIDASSSAIIYKSSISNGASPVQTVVIENRLVVIYWNTKSNRMEVDVVDLFDGMIDNAGLTPFATKSSAALAQKYIDRRTFSSFSPHAPLAIQKTYVLPKTTHTAISSVTAQGISKKSLVLGTSSGQVFQLESQQIDPRRPLQDPSQNEKMEGLFKYDPFLQFDATAASTLNYSMAYPAEQILSSSSYLESSSLILAISPLDIHFNRILPSQAFDLLANDFNAVLVTLILVALGCLCVWMKFLVNNRKKAKNWE